MTAPDLLPHRPVATAPQPVVSPTPAPPFWRDALVALSAANLCFLHVWAASPPFLRKETLFLLHGKPYPPSHYIGLAVNTAILGLLIALLIHFPRRPVSPPVRLARRIGCAGLALLVINALRVTIAPNSHLLRLNYWLEHGSLFSLLISALLFTVILAAAALRLTPRLAQLLRSTLLVLSPLFAFNLIGGAFYILSPSHFIPPHPQAHLLPSHPAKERSPLSSRLVFLLYDELDEELLFDSRPPDLSLPHFDRLRHGSTRITGLTCGVQDTLHSVPEITTGRSVADMRISPSHSVELRLQKESRWLTWGQTNDFFRFAHSLGARTAVVGWYIPYCSIFGDVLSQCISFPATFVGFPTGTTLPENMLQQYRYLLAWRPLSLYLPLRPPELSEYMKTDAAFRERAFTALSDASIDFVFLHIPTSHAPYFYNSRRGRFIQSTSERPAYTDALAFSDLFLSFVMDTIARSPSAMRTSLVLTSDHPLRGPGKSGSSSLARIPVLVHFKGQTVGDTVTCAERHTVLHDIVKGILSGQIDASRDLLPVCAP